MTLSPNERMMDWTECPHCVAENDRVGGGRGHADRYFNDDCKLWAVCSIHRVRWYVTREMMCAPDATADDVELPIVTHVWRIKHDGWRGGRSGPRP